MESISENRGFEIRIILIRSSSPLIVCHAKARCTYTKFDMFIDTRQYFFYILTNYKKTVLYTGVTNNLEQRIIEHYLERGKTKTFTGKYNAFYLLYYAYTKYINNAIAREKEIKGWDRKKKEKLTTSFNQSWKFLNHELLGE